jgi:hypothetical protein
MDSRRGHLRNPGLIFSNRYNRYCTKAFSIPSWGAGCVCLLLHVRFKRNALVSLSRQGCGSTFQLKDSGAVLHLHASRICVGLFPWSNQARETAAQQNLAYSDTPSFLSQRILSRLTLRNRGFQDSCPAFPVHKPVRLRPQCDRLIVEWKLPAHAVIRR